MFLYAIDGHRHPLRALVDGDEDAGSRRGYPCESRKRKQRRRNQAKPHEQSF